MLDQLAFSGHESESEARSKIAEWADKTVDGSDALHGIIWKANAMTRLAGQLFVRDIELGGRVRSLEASGSTQNTFLNMPFTAAIEHFESRSVLPPDEFDDLIDQERTRAFTARLAMSDAIRQSAFTRLSAAMQPGGLGLGSFINDMSPGFAGATYPGGVRNYLEMVYRTSTATSYNAGRYRQQTDPDVLALGLISEYRTAKDTRVRSEHALLDGKQWAAGDPELEAVYPPNGYNCRCVIALVEASNQDQLSREVDLGAAIQDGFGGTPGAQIDQES